MSSLAERGIAPSVVADQVGRLTFTEDLARAAKGLVESEAPYGVYNVTSEGDPASWADIARAVFELTGHDPQAVTPVTTADYFASASAPVAPRPRNSVLALDKLHDAGIRTRDMREALRGYLADG